MAESTPQTPAEPTTPPPLGSPAPEASGGPAVEASGTPPPSAAPQSAASPSAAASAGPDGGPATPPRVAPWLLLYTLGRIAIAGALVLVLWVAGLGSYAGLLFGILLSMPVSYLVLRPVRDRLTEALAARSIARRAAKEALRARLSGGDDDD